MPQADGKQIATTKISQNRTTTIPDAVRTAENLGPEDHVEWRLIDDEWVLRPASDTCACGGEGEDA